MAPLVQEVLRLLHALRGHGLYLARRHDALAKEVTDHEVALVAQDGRGPCDAKQHKDVEAAVVREESRCKQQRVTRKKREEHDARLDKDDEKHKAVRHDRSGGDGACDGRAGVLQQLDDEVHESHARKSLPLAAPTRARARDVAGPQSLLTTTPLAASRFGASSKCARWERAPARGSLWLLPSGPDQVRNSTSPEPIEHTHGLILYPHGAARACVAGREHQMPTSSGRHLASAATAPRRYATLGATKYRRRQNERPRHRHGRRA